MISYAQNAEDVVLSRVLPQNSGFYVDVGAADAVTASVTKHFYDKGWHGINIDPRIDAVRSLQKFRPRDINLELAVADFDGVGALIYNEQDPDQSSVALDAPVGDARTVVVRRLDSVLEEHNVEHIDFLKIDAEGAEARVLGGIDLARWSPRVVVVEAVRPWSHDRTDAGWRELLEDAGYQEGCFDGVNLFFAHREDHEVLTRLSPASVLDDFTPAHVVLMQEEIERLRDYSKHAEDELDRRRQGLTEVEEYVRVLEGALEKRADGTPEAATGSADASPLQLVIRAPAAELRVAVMGTPRTGNTWLRRVLADAFDAEEIAVHHPADIPWDSLPTRFVIQLHWPRTRHMEWMLQSHDVKVISLARHPLDVLLSIHKFVQHGQETDKWLAARAGDESAIRGVDVSADAFTSWASSERASALLDVTPQWWLTPSTTRERYEALLAGGLEEFEGLVERLGSSLRRPLADALSYNTPDRLAALSGGVHVWRAQAGLYRSCLTTDQAARLYALHRSVFDALGYGPPDAPVAS